MQIEKKSMKIYHLIFWAIRLDQDGRRDRWGKYFVNFTPAISNKSKRNQSAESERLETAIEGK